MFMFIVRMLKHRFSLFCIALFLWAFTGCALTEPSQSEFVLGTICRISLYEQGKPEVYRDIFRRFREIEDRMSVGLEQTDVARINANAGIGPVTVHEDVFEVIERAVYYAEISEGAFDPTVGPLVSLWGIGGDNERVPSREEIDAVLPLVGWRNIDLEKEHCTVYLKRSGMALDLGAIAKGFAADEAAEIVKKAGIKRAIIDLGGNILIYGEKKDKSPWRVGIQNPFDSRGAYVGIVQVGEKTVVSSGVYERFFEAEGVRYHHILSPFEGGPAQSGLLSVSIVTDRSMDADALSTAVFVLGYERGRALIESLEGVAGVFILDDMSIRLSGRLDFILTDDKYRIVSEQ
ncbi:FAD:protein FMN transferase [Spirochaetia bacterium]|nr:FAD:protein FMN transferase [Spirochaetia bacterium]